MPDIYTFTNLGTCRIELYSESTGSKVGISLDLKYATKKVQPKNVHKGITNVNEEIIKEEIKQRISIKILIPTHKNINTQTNLMNLDVYTLFHNQGGYYFRVYPNYYSGYTLISQQYFLCVIDDYPDIKQLKSNLNVGHMIQINFLSKFPQYFYPVLPQVATTTNPIGLSTAGNTGDFLASNPGLELLTGYVDLISLPDYVDDDDIFAIPTMYAGFGDIMIGDNQEYTMIRFDNHGGITLIDNTANISTTKNTAAKLNIYDNGEGIAFQNKLGAPLSLAIDIYYYLP